VPYAIQYIAHGTKVTLIDHKTTIFNGAEEDESGLELFEIKINDYFFESSSSPSSFGLLCSVLK